LLESAYFNPRSVRRTSKYLALSTDASQRFERGADPNITRFAADRCCQLIQELAGGSVLKGVVDVYPRKLKPQLVKLRAQRTNDVLGTHLREKTIVQILSSLEIFPVKDSKKKKRKPEALQFQVPTFRPDLEREIDLIEEVGRIYGYDRIETKESTALRFSSQPIPVEISDLLRDLLLGEGYREIVTNSLQKESIASIGGDRFVRIMNPLSDEMAALRTNLVPGMLEVIRFNINHGRKDLKLFEIGKVFRMGSDVEKGEFFQDYIEEERVVIAQTGLADAPGWGKPERQSDFFDLKGVVEILLGKIFLDKNRFIYYSTTNTLTEYSLGIEFHGGYVGFLGKILPSTLFEFGIEEDVYVAELSVDRLKQAQLRKPIFETPPKYPPVARDLAFVVDESTPAAEVEGAIRASAGELLKRVQLFDVYKGERVGGGKKSCAYSLEFLSRDRTLTEDEVEKITQRVVRFVEEKLQAKLRS
jgi:phenylalanyl-tRNA synthetase beta chain